MREYKLTVPVLCQNLNYGNLEKTLDALKQCGADRVFVSCSPYYVDLTMQERQLTALKKVVSFFQQNGIETGVWIFSSQVVGESDFLYKIKPDGNEFAPWLCHADEKFLSFSEDYVQKLAKTGAQLIMYDDDFHFFGLGGCRCAAHRQLFANKYGKYVDFDKVGDLAYAAAPNKEREMWLDVMGGSLETFARRMRAALDKVSPSTRLGFCANQTNFGIEGTDVVKLSKLFAGDTKPFVRLIGAPYWPLYYKTYEMPLVLENERLALAELEHSDIEIMTEGDVFPRPRTAVPAAMLEIFDTVLRADGKSEGILKYMLDYYAPVNYETGYLERHIANKSLYLALDEHFFDKPCVGVRVYSDTRRYTEADFRYAFGDRNYMLRRSNSHEGRFLGCLSIPTTYEGRGTCGIAFGENTRYLDDDALNGGIITDLVGAIVLKEERGIDVGLRKVLEQFEAGAEWYGEGTFHRLGDTKSISKNSFREITIDDKAEVISWYTERLPQLADEFDELKKAPAAYRYVNADGQRFFVLAFAAHTLPLVAFHSYGKATQLLNACEWLGEHPLPAKCCHNPDLYIICKQNSESLSVGLWNISPDYIAKPLVELDKEYSEIVGINCEATLCGNVAHLSALEPYAFCGIVVK